MQTIGEWQSLQIIQLGTVKAQVTSVKKNIHNRSQVNKYIDIDYLYRALPLQKIENKYY